MYIRYQVDGMLYKTPPNRWKKISNNFFLYYFTSSQNSIREFSIHFSLYPSMSCIWWDRIFSVYHFFWFFFIHCFPLIFLRYFFGLLNFWNSFVSFIKTSSILVLSSKIRLRQGFTVVFLKCWMIFFICRFFFVVWFVLLFCDFLTSVN